MSWAACLGSRVKMSGRASAVSILAMMPLMRSISASASAIRCFGAFSARALTARLRSRACAALGRLARGGAVAARRQHQAPVIVEIAVIVRHRMIGHEPEPVGAGLDQIAVMRDHDDRAGKFVDRFGKRGAAVDVEMVGRLVQDDHVGAEEGRKPEQQPRLLAAGQACRPACRRPCRKSRSRRRGRAPSLSGASGISLRT